MTLCRRGGSYHCMGMGKLRHEAKRCNSSPAQAAFKSARGSEVATSLQTISTPTFGVSFSAFGICNRNRG